MFDTLYTQMTALRQAYHQVKTEEEKNSIVEQYNTFNTKIKKMDKYTRMIWDAYSDSKERNNVYLDFSEVIWDKDVLEFINKLKEFGIETFTFSSTWSNSVSTAWFFQQNGYEVRGLVEINKRETQEGIFEKIPAYQFILKK